jgi:general secretion pathway protein H
MRACGQSHLRTASASGFTLIEMLVALSIMAMIAGLVSSAFWGQLTHAELRSSAASVAATLRDVRGRALAHGRTEIFVADLHAGTFAIGGDPRKHTIPRGIGIEVMTTIEDSIDDSVGLIRFFADGSSSGGAVILTRDGARMDVRVDWLSGRTVVSEASTRLARHE